MKKPIKKLTIPQIAAQICLLPVNREYSFSQNEDGSDYWGVIRLQMFDADFVLISYYGQSPTWVFDLYQDDVFTTMIEAFKSEVEEEFLWVFEE